MNDLPILLALLAVAWCAWRQPWVGVLGLVFVSVMHPQGYATGWLRGTPAYLAIGVVVGLCAVRQFVVARRLPVLFWDWRFAVAALLAVHMVVSTWLGIIPDVKWGVLADIGKMLPMLVLVLLLIDDREKLWYLLLTIALSIAVVVIKGGFWAVATGFENRVYGPPGSQYGDNNGFAVATAMAIPLLALWLRQVQGRVLKWLLAGLIGLAFAAALSSWSRGGLLCVAVVATLLVWHSRHRGLGLLLLSLVIGVFLFAVPDAWFDRMQTLLAPAQDDSAASRLEVWRLGWDYALAHPWFGSGIGGWFYLSLPTGGFRAWHSAYVQVAAEHGLFGLLLWCALLFGSVVDLSLSMRQARRRRHPWLGHQAAMLRASLAAYAVGSAFLSIAFWELLFLLIVASILTRRVAHREAGLIASPGALDVVSEKLTSAPHGAIQSGRHPL
jgi:putative inorganic carbon (HCO3(-)) transporter